MQYNEEEVKELFEVVFKLSAKDINDKLTKVRNRPEIAKRRWFWELLQNAKDAVKKDEKVSVRLEIDSVNELPFVKFLHNGNPFRYDDAKNLIFPYSDKSDEKDSDKSGRFGTGFLATHILSKFIEVKGIYTKEHDAYEFSFTLDRSGEDKPKIAESINKTWQQFRENIKPVKDYVYTSKEFETSFKYNLEPDALLLVKESIIDICESLPFALAFIPKIDSIEIDNRIEGESIRYKVIHDKTEQLSENIKKVIIEKEVLEKGKENINLIVCANEKLQIAIKVSQRENKILINELSEHCPLLYCPFPLISSLEFKFPCVINSEHFLPKEERDGIWLVDTVEGKINQSLLETVIPLYDALLDYVSNNNLNNPFFMLKSLKEDLLIADFNSKWFKEKIQTPMKLNSITIPLVDVSDKVRLPISLDGKTVHFPYHIDPEKRLILWDFLSDLFPANIPLKHEVSCWHDVIWEDCKRDTLNSLAKYVSGFKSVELLSQTLSISKDETFNWLDRLVAFISKEEPSLLNGKETFILPNQHGIFKKKDELYLDDDSIDDELKDVLADIAKISKKVNDWRNDLLEKKIYLELPASRTKTLSSIGVTISDIVKELLKEDNPSNELKSIYSRLLNWLNDHPNEAKEYFKGLKTETLLYKTANENKIRHITDLLQKDRNGEVSVEQLSNIDAEKLAMLNDPNLGLKVMLGEKVLEDQNQAHEEFLFKKRTGDIFENIFKKIISEDNRLGIKKVEGEEDFIITNINNGKSYYIELKSHKQNDLKINLTHKQAKKAANNSDNYILCVIPNNGESIDENYFITNAIFDFSIGKKLSQKVNSALELESSDNGISVEFEDALLASFNKHRYKFLLDAEIIDKTPFESFKGQIIS